jgi:polyhydroxyalkanoate synthesis repressor PhaR
LIYQSIRTCTDDLSASYSRGYREIIDTNAALCYSSLIAMARKPKTTKSAADADGNPDRILIKRYGNRRLYNTETSGYLNYQELVKLIRDGHDVQVIDSRTKADVTKAVLMQVILEEEKNQSVLPVSFLFQVIRSRESAVQDFFKNYLSSSFEAYLKTKEEFDRRFRGFLQMGSTAPELWEKLVPGADVVKEFWGLGKKEEEKK